MTERLSEACVRAISSAGTPPERRFDPAVALAFGYDLRAARNSQCAEGRGIPGGP